ncbi:TfuA-like protein [Spirillospora sp. NPDC050679]
MGGLTVVFLGPSLPLARARALLDARYRPPARLGDVYRAVRAGARRIGIIDGYFERTPAVWHKEVMWALAQGVPVYGAASMGALRAAELDAFGMTGVGEVYRWYRDGVIEDDDEVALLHAPAEGGYAAASVPLVNIRATLDAARGAGIVPADLAEALCRAARALHYPDRSYDRVIADGRAAGLGSPAALDAFEAWLPRGAVDLKGRDAALLLRTLASDRRIRPPAGTVPFEPTWIWQELVTGLGQE